MTPSPEFTAAHEAGHAVVYLACGIPVLWVEVLTTARRYGFTETAEDLWMGTSALPLDSKLVRRLLGKAGGVAGESAADLYDPKLAWGAGDDVGQIGDALKKLRLLEPDAKAVPPALLLRIVEMALRIVMKNKTFFDDLRMRLRPESRVLIADLRPFELVEWSPDEEAAFLGTLKPVEAA